MKERNCSIDIFRYLCAVLVVAVHTHPFTDVSRGLGDLFTQILPRIAVPFFFAVAGYYYLEGLKAGKKGFWQYLRRILKPYLLWSCVYYLVEFLQKGYQAPGKFLLRCVYTFFLSGSSYHFWFFPALIFAVCAATVIFRLRWEKILLPLSFVLYAVGCLGCSYRALGLRIPGLSALYTLEKFTAIRRILLMGFPFFLSGLLVSKILERLKRRRIAPGKLWLPWLVLVGLWLLEIVLVRCMDWQENIILTFGLYPLTVATLVLLLCHPMPQHRELSRRCRTMADFTYYAHPLVITLLSFGAERALGREIPETLLFVLVVLITGLLGVGIHRRKDHAHTY